MTSIQGENRIKMVSKTFLSVMNYRKTLGLIGLVAIVFLSVYEAHAQESEGKSGVAPQVISLPSGPGTLDGLGESFQPNLNTGTAVYAYDLTIPPAVNDFAPTFRFQYNGG